MIQFQEQVLISAPPEKVFSLYAKVTDWPSWDPDVKQSSIEGSFSSGAGGTLTPSKGPKAKILFIEVVQNKSFTVDSKLPLCVMRFEHELVREGDQTKAVHRITFQGLLSGLFGRIIGNQIRTGLPNTLKGLKRAAEVS
jgi:ligand-binding SRPBCC domain-containing protein